MDRRSFMLTTASTSILVKASNATPDPAPDVELPVNGLTKSTIPTPALVVDRDALDANIARMADHCRRARKSFRPHTKTHKCPAIAQLQLDAGAVGVCSATVAEAESMVHAGIQGVLLTSPIVDAGKISRMIALVQRGQNTMLAVGNVQEAELLAEAASAARITVDILIDVDVGDRRTGVLPGPPSLEFTQLIAKYKTLRVMGIQAYAGHASHTVGFEARKQTSRTAMQKAVESLSLLQQAGFDAKILSVGSTGTYNIDSAIDGISELQVGSYIFMDVDYRRIGAQDGNPTYADFRPSLTILTTVVSATHSDRVTVDAGTKAIDTTTANRAEPKDWTGLIYSKSGDEFGAITFDGDAKRPKVGDRIEFLAPHCDPTVNLYDRLYVCRGDQVQAIWKISARREV